MEPNNKVVSLFKKLGSYHQKKMDSAIFRTKSYLQGKLNQHNYKVKQTNQITNKTIQKANDVLERRFRINVINPVKKFMGSKVNK